MATIEIDDVESLSIPRQLIRLNRYVPDGFPRKAMFRSAMPAAARSARRSAQTCSKSKPTKWMPRSLMALNRSCLKVGPTPVSRKRHPDSVEGSSLGVHEPTACTPGSCWAEDGSRQIGRRDGHNSSIVSRLVRKYIWYAVCTAKSTTFPATSNDGQSRAVSGRTLQAQNAKSALKSKR